jgi:hypothetical protein
MSEWSMMTGSENWRIAYPAFLGAMLIMGLANFLVLRWIDQRSGDDREQDVPGTALRTRAPRAESAPRDVP